MPKLIIVVLMILMVTSLASAFWYMIKDRGKSDRTVKALTLRISIWVALFLILVGGVYSGLITPSNSIRLHPSQEQQ
ncbi:MAG: DUF2909 domain-containing protein [Gammaproteobacteria bacterium]|nr:DUF2909 domain-containing protein [Gammaproteobacteria bacterium]